MRRVYTVAKGLKLHLPMYITYRSLADYAMREGWRIITYGDGRSGDEELQACGMAKYAQGVDSFACRSLDGRIKIIGIRANVTSEKHIWLMAHELGHILLDHTLGKTSDKEEREANKFAKKLLENPKKHQNIVVSAVIAAMLAVASFIYFVSPIWANTDDPSSLPVVETSYVITPSGSCYHVPNCPYIGNEVIPVSIEQVAVLGKRPCQHCID